MILVRRSSGVLLIHAGDLIVGLGILLDGTGGFSEFVLAIGRPPY